MNDRVETLAAATDRAAQARVRLIETATEVRDRLSPARLARDARDRMTGAGSAAASAGIDSAKRHSATLAATAVAALLLLTRRRIARLFRTPRY